MGKVTSVFDLVADGIKAGRERSQRARDLGYDKNVFHSTNQDFDEIDTSKVDIGFHVGTKEQANNRSKNLQKEKLGLPFESDATFENKGIPLHREGSNIMPLKLRTSGEVLELPDIGNWDNSTFVARALAENRGGNVPKQLQDRAFAISELIEDFMETDEAFELAMDINKWTASPQNRGLLDELNTLIRDEGFSTIKYSNQYENTFLSKAAPRQEIVNRIDSLSEELATVSDPIKRADIETRINTARQEAMDSQVNDAFSYIVLDPSDVRSTSAAFKDGESKNILAGATSIGLGTVFTAAALAPQDAEAGFFSQAVKAAQNLTRKTGNAQGFKNDLTGKGQVKPDELKAMGFDEHFGDRKDITKEEVQQFINDNQVQIKETVLGDAPTLSDAQLAEWANQNFHKGYEDFIAAQTPRERKKALAHIEDIYKQEAVADSKFGDYTLEGGDNYRELLMSLPNQKSDQALRLAQKRYDLRREDQEMAIAINKIQKDQDSSENPFLNAEEAKQRIDVLNGHRSKIGREIKDIDVQIAENGYVPDQFVNTGHFDEPNILAHLRMKDRVDADGNKTLLIEEAQSDWHQKGADVGYKSKDGSVSKPLQDEMDRIEQEMGRIYEASRTSDDPDVWMPLNEQFDNLNSELNRLKYKAGGGVPDAPFKTDDKSSWYNLAMKRGLIEAAEGDYDKLAITTGRQQAERYDLSKQINEVRLGGNEQDGFTVSAFDKDNYPVIVESIDTLDELPNLIGKDAAKSLVDQPLSKGSGLNSVDERRFKYLMAENEAGRAFGSQIEELNILRREMELAEKPEFRVLSGQDLSVGGDGMKEFYDRKLPNTLNKLVKQDGVKVGQSELDTGVTTSNRMSMSQEDRISMDLLEGRERAGDLTITGEEELRRLREKRGDYKRVTDTVHSIDITPEMRERVKKGLPLFTTAVGVPILNNMFAPKVQAAEYNEAPVIEEQSFGDMVNEYGQINRNLKALDDQRFARAVAEREARRGMSRRERRDNPPSEALRELAMQDMKPSLGSVAQGIVEGNAQGLDYFHPLNLGRMILNPANEGLGRFIAPSIVSTYENAVSPVAKPVLFDERDPKADEKSRSGKNFGNFFSLF